MARNNHPGDVAVLARSNTEGDPIDAGISSSGSPILTPFPGLPRAPTLPMPKLFPLAPQELLLARLKAQAQLAQQQPQIPNFNAQWLSNWLANNPFAQQLQGFQFLQNQQNLNVPIKCEVASSEDKMSDFDEAIEINNEEAESFTSTSGNVTPSSNTGVEPGEIIFKQSKEALTPELIARIGVIEHTATLSPRSGSQAEKQFVSPMSNQHSPTASDSHSSAVLEAVCLENKCFNCELNLSKSAASEERARLLEARIAELQSTLGTLSSQIIRHNELQQQQQQRIERPQLQFPLPFMNPEATKMKSILESLIQQQGIVQNLH